MLTLELARAPLDAASRRVVCREFNRLNRADLTEEYFQQWTERSPGGPALHALLKAPDGQIAGHCCLFPFPFYRDGTRVAGANADYLFVREEFRKEKIANYPPSNEPAALTLLKAMYRHGSNELGWNPILTSARREVAALHQFAGAVPIFLHALECLLVLRPWSACRRIPPLSASQRALIFLAGLFQSATWKTIQIFSRGQSHPRRLPADSGGLRWRSDQSGMTLPLDPDFLEWRYPEGGLDIFELPSATGSLVALRDSPTGFLRPIDCNFDLDRISLFAFLDNLVRQARRRKSLGVRFTFYRKQKLPDAAVGKLKRLGVLCKKRKRLILVYTKERDLASASRWRYTDDMLGAFQNG